MTLMKPMLALVVVVVGALAVIGNLFWQSQWESEPVSLEFDLYSGEVCTLLDIEGQGRLRVDCHGVVESIRYYCVTHGSEAERLLGVIMTDTVRLRLIWQGRGGDGIRSAEVFTHNPEDVNDTENVGLSLLLGNMGQVRDNCHNPKYLTAAEVNR